MVNFERPEYKRLSKTQKRELIDKLDKKADDKLDDIQFYITLMNDYKAKLATEKAKN